MSDICFVFSSTKEANSKNVISKYFKDHEFDVAYLCSEPKDKVLKKDIDIDIDKDIKDKYRFIAPIGAEPLKYLAGMTGVQKYNGILVENRYIPIMHPGIIKMKPQLEQDISLAFKKVEDILEGKVEEIQDKDYEFIDSSEGLSKYVDQIENAEVLAVDIETTSLSYHKGNIMGIAISVRPHQGIYISIDVVYDNLEWFHEIFASKKCVLHNSKFDIGFMEHELGFEFNDVEDTILMHHILDETTGSHSLKLLCIKYTDLGDYERELDTYKKDLCRQAGIKLEDFSYDMFPIDMLAPYACKDVDGTIQLYHKFKSIIDKNKKFDKVYEDIMKPASAAIVRLEKNGGPINKQQLDTLKKGYEIDIEECLNEIRCNPAVARFEEDNEKIFNPNSTYQVAAILKDYLKVPLTKKTPTGNFSVDIEVLESLSDNPFVETLIDFRQKNKLLSTYVNKIQRGLDPDGRLRSGFNLTGTTSGRLSSSGNLNYQNIPRDNKDIKKLFQARPGYVIVNADLTTAEVYYAAALSKDEFLQDVFRNKRDFHSYIAHSMFNLKCDVSEVKKEFPTFRQISKAITFGILYQAGPAKIASEVNENAKPGEEITVEEAKRFINLYFQQAKGLKTYIDNISSFIEGNAYIYSAFNRKRRLPEIRSSKRSISKHALRSGINFVIQSVSSDVNTMIMTDLMSWLDKEDLHEAIIPFTTVHDALVSEIKEEYLDMYVKKHTEISKINRGVGIPDCPIGVEFETGPSWGELSEYKLAA